MSTLTLDTFQVLLNGFKDAIKDNPPAKQVEDELKSMIEIASNDNELTFWQKDAIIARCKNYISGTYGSSSKTLNTGYYEKK
jgi:hypothetical protein